MRETEQKIMEQGMISHWFDIIQHLTAGFISDWSASKKSMTVTEPKIFK